MQEKPVTNLSVGIKKFWVMKVKIKILNEKSTQAWYHFWIIYKLEQAALTCLRNCFHSNNKNLMNRSHMKMLDIRLSILKSSKLETTNSFIGVNRHQHSVFEANIKRIRVDNDFKKPYIHSKWLLVTCLQLSKILKWLIIKHMGRSGFWFLRKLQVFEHRFVEIPVSWVQVSQIFLHIKVFVWQYLHGENNLLNYGIWLEPIFCKM